MNHCTVAHYASLHDRVTIKTSRGINFIEEKPPRGAGRVGVVKVNNRQSRYEPALKLCPQCGIEKLFKMAGNKYCSRQCSANSRYYPPA